MASRPTSGDNHPYKPDVGLNVEYESKGLYRIFNRTANSNPFIQLEIREEDSILKSFFPETTVRDDDTLKAELKWQSRKWVLKVKGQLVNFPGRSGINWVMITLPEYRHFEYERCIWRCTLSYSKWRYMNRSCSKSQRKQ